MPSCVSAQTGLQNRSGQGSTGRRCHYVYRTVNLLNGKIYVGVGVSIDPEGDGYLGSGKLITKAVAKYGCRAFAKEILGRFKSAPAAYAMERQIVDERFVDRNDTYNLKVGGSGGFDYVNRARLNVSGRNFRPGNLLSSDGALIQRLKEKGTYEAYLRRQSEAAAKHIGCANSFYGHHHSTEAKRQIGEKNSILLRGARNGAYGTRWVTNGQTSVRILAAEVDAHISQGWILGRVIAKAREDAGVVQR